MAGQSKEELWDIRIAEYRKSGMPAEEWCKVNNCKLTRLRYWIRKQNQKKEHKAQEWLGIENLCFDKGSSPIVIKIGVATIDIPEEFNTETLSKVLKAFGI